MSLETLLIAFGLWSGAPAAEPSPYRHIEHPAEPAAQLAEMLALYDQVCLHAFPDDKAVAVAMAGRRAEALVGDQIKRYLHDDPGIGWRVTGATGIFNLTVEAPPFHACGVRTMTPSGFADLGAYRALADTFEAGHGFQKIAPLDRVIDQVHTWGGGEMRHWSGGDEGLLTIFSTPVDEARSHGDDSLEVRFVHQVIAQPPAPAQPQA
jgi:hypothetical protein